MTLPGKVAALVALVIAAVALPSLGYVTTSQARAERAAFLGANLQAMQLLSLSIAPSITGGRHDAVQAVIDNVANFPERFPDVRSLEILDRHGVVIADLDPRRFHVEHGDATALADLRRTEPIARYVGDELRIAVPIRITYPLGVLRARIGTGRLDARIARRRTEAVALAAVGILALAAPLFMALRALFAANRRLEALAITDSLTHLYNRRHFEERTRHELEVARRHGRPWSLLMLDIDRFKSINDRFGHAAGDVVLADIAEVLRREARAADLVARVGGEEFAVALPDTGADEALLAGERIRAAIERAAHPRAEGLEEPVTASFGVATFPEHGGTLDALLRASDDALYRAKEKGRNRTELAPRRGAT